MQALEFIALQAQITPHFLFNILKTIYWKSVNAVGQRNDLGKMIQKTFEYSLLLPGNTQYHGKHRTEDITL